MANMSFDPNMATESAVTTKWASKEDWATHQAVIRNLYKEHTLSEVRKTMETQYGSKQRKLLSQVRLSSALIVSLRLKIYKTHIKQWGLDKKSKENEMQAVMRKTVSRVSKGKESTFYIRGKTVNFEYVVRYWQRKGVFSIDEMIAQREASKTPEAVECFTPVLSSLSAPDELAIDEQILLDIRDYHRFSIQAREGSLSMLAELLAFNEFSLLACRLFARHSPQEAGQALIKATTGIQSIVQAPRPLTISYLLQTIGVTLSYGKIEIATAILRQFAAMSDCLLAKEHPFRIICSRLTLLDLSDRFHLVHIFRLSMGVIIECLEKLLGPLHEKTIQTRLRMMASCGDTHNHRQEELGLKGLLRECELALGPDDDRTMEVGVFLASYYEYYDNPTEAKRLAQALRDQTRSHWCRVCGLDLLARSQHDLGDIVAAKRNMRKAIELAITKWGCHDADVHRMMLTLEGWLVEQGKPNSAAQLREERMGYWKPVELL